MPHDPVSPSDSEPPKSTSKQLPTLEECSAVVKEHPLPSGYKVLYCIWFQPSETEPPSRVDITADVVVQESYETQKEWFESIGNYAFYNGRRSPFILATTSMHLAIKWGIMNTDVDGMRLYTIDPTKLKPGSMIKMNSALHALGGKRKREHKTKFLIWQTIPAEAVRDCSPFCKFINSFPWLEHARWLKNSTLVVCFLRYYQSDTDRSFKDWWIATLPKGPNSTDSEPGICQIIENFHLMKDS